jgi:hypothetical protein
MGLSEMGLPEMHFATVHCSGVLSTLEGPAKHNTVKEEHRLYD